MIKHKKVETAVETENVDYEMNKSGFDLKLSNKKSNRLTHRKHHETLKRELKYYNERADWGEKFKIWLMHEISMLY